MMTPKDEAIYRTIHKKNKRIKNLLLTQDHHDAQIMRILKKKSPFSKATQGHYAFIGLSMADMTTA